MLKSPPPKGDRYYGKRADDYSARRTQQKWWHVEHEEMRQLLADLPRGLSVVDIPFGTGRFVPLYLDRGFEVSGVEISDHMIAAARKELGDSFDRCDVRQGSSVAVPFEDKSCDLVVSTRFLSNIITYAEARKTLAEFNRISRRYGIIQLGHGTTQTAMPRPNQTMDVMMSETDVDALLGEFGFRPIERRMVLSNAKTGGQMHHVLCEKIEAVPTA